MERDWGEKKERGGGERERGQGREMDRKRGRDREKERDANWILHPACTERIWKHPKQKMCTSEGLDVETS